MTLRALDPFRNRKCLLDSLSVLSEVTPTFPVVEEDDVPEYTPMVPPPPTLEPIPLPFPL